MISIIVPCYNCEETLQITINSLLTQTDGVFEIILVDDGSTDSTPQICDAIAIREESVITIHQSNMGLMGAWKRGVIESRGDYIVFCDSDDYIEEDFIDRVGRIIDNYYPDLIVCGMIHEYPNGDTMLLSNRIQEGYYNRDDLNKSILPKLLSDGDMQSEAIIRSRCSKVFRRSVLIKTLSFLSNKVSFGEDILTVFTVMQIVQDMYCMGEYFPYHYVRNPDSMIGCFDRNIFVKIDLLYKEMNDIAEKMSYPYHDQLLYDRMSITLLYIKKYICKSNDGFISTKDIIKKVRDSKEFCNCIRNCSIRRYSLSNRIFARLFMWRMFFAMYFLSRLYEQFRGRNV